MGGTLGCVANIGLFLFGFSSDKGPREPQGTDAALPQALQADLDISGELLDGFGKKDTIIYHNKIFTSARTPRSTLRMAKVMHILSTSLTGNSKALRKEHSGLQQQFP